MSRWAGKTVIGLTGNIATGKSIVRKMLEHLGAFGLDADKLAHRVIAKGAPGYQPIIDAFGRYILDENEEISRPRLGKIVFSDPAALKQLEEIVHPLVSKVLNLLVKKVKRNVIVVEAIKLFESDIADSCDIVWVTAVDRQTQHNRLVSKRKMDPKDAWQRINAQPPQQEKTDLADVVITTNGSIEDTWLQVQQAWQKLVPQEKEDIPAVHVTEVEEYRIERARPTDSDDIAELINRHDETGVQLNRSDVIQQFGEKAFLLVRANERFVGLLGWQVENLIARMVDFIIDPEVNREKVIPELIKEMEKASLELQCEVSLLFVPEEETKAVGIFEKEGYTSTTLDEITVPAWKEAAFEHNLDKKVLFIKPLREDRILRPI